MSYWTISFAVRPFVRDCYIMQPVAMAVRNSLGGRHVAGGRVSVNHLSQNFDISTFSLQHFLKTEIFARFCMCDLKKQSTPPRKFTIFIQAHLVYISLQVSSLKLCNKHWLRFFLYCKSTWRHLCSKLENILQNVSIIHY